MQSFRFFLSSFGVFVVLNIFTVVNAAPALTIVRGSGNTYQVSWLAEALTRYQMQLSADFKIWTNLGNPITGTGTVRTVAITSTEPEMFCRVRDLPIRPGFNTSSLAADDDNNSSDFVPLGFSISLFESIKSGCYVNNNGNITFDSIHADYTPNPLRSAGEPIMAPFWSDVDTRLAGGIPPLGKVVTYGTGTVDGKSAFGVNWIDVGYFEFLADKLNSFQLILIQRSDTGSATNFDVDSTTIKCVGKRVI